MPDLTSEVLSRVIRARPAASHKGTFGRVLIIGGCRPYQGAVQLCTQAAVASGTGLVTVVTDPHHLAGLQVTTPEAVAYAFDGAWQQERQHATVCVIGPGLGDGQQATQLLADTLASCTPTTILVIDASALTLLAQKKWALPTCHVILTPHLQEWARLSGVAIDEQTPARNQLALDQLGQATRSCTLVLKKHHTELYTAGASDWQRLPIGGPHQAVAGMGDTLAGIVASFVAQFRTCPYHERIAAAVYCHSAVADQLATKYYITTPSTLISALPEMMAEVSKGVFQ